MIRGVLAAVLTAAAARAEPPELSWKDVGLFAGGAATAFVAHEAGHALSDSVRDARASRVLTTGLLLGIAGADIARWAFPDVAFLAWVSRAAKVVFLGLPLLV